MTYQESFFCVVTSIQAPTPALIATAERVAAEGGALIVIGDEPGPKLRYNLPSTECILIDDQRQLPFQLNRGLPTRHYSRKNIGYLLAIQRGAKCIFETDDDNAPSGRWKAQPLNPDALGLASSRWVNVYSHFTDLMIWPRGFPLEKVRDHAVRPCYMDELVRPYYAPIQQCLADGSPDVDAVWRLLLDTDVKFSLKPSVRLAPHSWCPFNSQATWWWPEAFPLLYLPSHCSFRMTDIWRSFVAQRCIWELGCGIVFHQADVFQSRNEHNLHRDFIDEVPGYQSNNLIVSLLDDLTLEPGSQNVSRNMLKCYSSLVDNGLLPYTELTLLNSWISDIKSVSNR